MSFGDRLWIGLGLAWSRREVGAGLASDRYGVGVESVWVGLELFRHWFWVWLVTLSDRSIICTCKYVLVIMLDQTSVK